VVNVTSLSHKQGNMDFENLLFENGKDFSAVKAYGRSKLSNLLFTYELQRFFEANKIDCIAVAAHPGIANTNNPSSVAEKNMLMKLYKLSFSSIIQPPSLGALSEIRASVDQHVKGGDFYGPGGLLELSGHPTQVRPKHTALNTAIAHKLWVVSENLTAVSYH